jgi:hypothetical protein
MRNFETVVQELRNSPLSFVDCRCAMLLGAFMSGYQLVDTSARPIWEAAALSFPGPSVAGAATRAVLNFRTSEEAFVALVAVLEQEASRSKPQPVPGPLAADRWIESVRQPLLSRPAMVLGDPLVCVLAHQARGYLAGLDVVDGARATTERRVFEHFERGVRQRYGAPNASWGNVIRIFEGGGTEGLRQFVALWDELSST